MIDKYVIIAKTNLENVFLRYEKSERKWLYKIISLSGSAAISLTVSIFTTAKYQAVLFFSSHTSKSLIGLFAVLSWLVFIVFICIWGFFKYKKKLKDLSGLQADIINENMYKEDFTYILLIPTYNGKQLLFPVIQKDTWENSLFFPYLKHNYGNDAVSLHKQDIEKDIRAKYSISIPLRIKEIV